MTMFSDTKFPSSITLTAADWQTIVHALIGAEEFDLANTVQAEIGRRPE